MEKEITKYLTGISIGLRFGPSFSVCEEAGGIIDEILYSQDSYFNKELFPKVSSLPFQLRLENQETGDYLLISNQDIILNINFVDTLVISNLDIKPIQQLNDITDIHNNFKLFLELLNEYSVDRIQRLGYVHRYTINEQQLIKNVVDHLVGNTINGVNDMQLRFSKKYPVQEALIKKGINNYHNVIYILEKKTDLENLNISLDYQEFYEPLLENTAKIDFGNFMERLERYNTETLPEWISKVSG